MTYSDYQQNVKADIEQCLATLQCQPVILAGAGISKRYFGAPSWSELLEQLAVQCPKIEKEFAYYAQSFSSLTQIASEFAKAYREWAWGSGRNSFPPELFDASVRPDAFLKHAAARLIKEITPTALAELDEAHRMELEALAAIKPHAIITTNYDELLELVFPDFEKVVGQKALRGLPFTIGEIFKIHGCVSDSSELVLTDEDYAVFAKKKKFLAARLLTLFNEHPLIVVGYSASDENIRALLSDIDEALALPGDLIENIYFIEYDPQAEKRGSLPFEKLIKIEENRSVRVKQIVTSDLRWVFNAFKSPQVMNAVPSKVLRALLSRSYELVRSDLPRKTLEVDFKFLEQKLENAGQFAELFGITTVSDASLMSAKFPFSATELGMKLGGNSWHCAIKLFNQIKEETGLDLKASDNRYHRLVKVNRSQFHKYSDEAVKLLQKVQSEKYCDVDWIDVPAPEPDLFDAGDSTSKKAELKLPGM